jgi:hypothetical protein
LATLGEGHIAYVKQIRSEDVPGLFPQAPKIAPGLKLFALHAADGTPIMLTDSREAAIANAWSNELQAVSVHWTRLAGHRQQPFAAGGEPHLNSRYAGVCHRPGRRQTPVIFLELESDALRAVLGFIEVGSASIYNDRKIVRYLFARAWHDGRRLSASLSIL